MVTRTVLACVFAVALFPSTGVAQTASADESAVRETVNAFRRALADGDGDTALGYLGDGVRIFESGHAETRDQYASGHMRADMAFSGAVERTTTWDQVDVSGDVGVYVSEFTSKGTYRDREIDSHGTETMIVGRTSDGWKILHIHWSSR